MNRVLPHITARIAVIGVVILALCGCAYVAGARINTTRSIPVGLYWRVHAPIERGGYVMFCPPLNNTFDIAKARGYIGTGMCPGRYGYMMKRVSAVVGDIVSVDDNGVWVNDALLPNSRPVRDDRAGRKLPYLRINRYTLGEDELLLMSDVSESSFDARYFGPVHHAQVKNVIRPVLVW